MKTIRCKFTVYADNSKIIKIEVPDDYSDKQIEDEINYEFDSWVENQIQSNIEIL